MNSSDFNKFIEDFSSINSSNSKDFERVLRKHPYFQTAALFLAKSNSIPENTQKAALRSADRKTLRSWLDEEYRQELREDKKTLEAKQMILETQEDEYENNLDINTESVNAFDKLVETDVKEEIKTDIETTLAENELEEDKQASTSNFFDDLESENSVIKTETRQDSIDSSSFFDDLEDNQELEKTQSSAGNSETNFFEEIDEITGNETEEAIFEQQLDSNEPLKTTDSNFFDEVDKTNESEAEKTVFEQQSDINEPLQNSVPSQTTDASFFDEVGQTNESETEEIIFEQQSDINEPLELSTQQIPPTTTDANFFDELEETEEVKESESEEFSYKEQSDINEPLPNSIPAETTDANFFDEIESDDSIFGDAQKDLDAYNLEDFPDFEDEKDETEKNRKADEGEGNFFDDI